MAQCWCFVCKPFGLKFPRIRFSSATVITFRMNEAKLHEYRNVDAHREEDGGHDKVEHPSPGRKTLFPDVSRSAFRVSQYENCEGLGKKGLGWLDLQLHVIQKLVLHCVDSGVCRDGPGNCDVAFQGDDDRDVN